MPKPDPNPRPYPDPDPDPIPKVAFDLVQKSYETLKNDDEHIAFRLRRSRERDRNREKTLSRLSATGTSAWALLRSLAEGDLLFVALVFLLLA
mmetsp:Transcript_27561/g.87247  ORF Transcript_27561/g.87247 Transcript_27561/m.87247 type:complete len:93 (-) Transcript_27561:2074-2352(-)